MLEIKIASFAGILYYTFAGQWYGALLMFIVFFINELFVE